MKLQLSDANKAKLKKLLRVIGDRLRMAGPPTGRWLFKHKASVAIVLLVLYILFMPHRVREPKLADAQPPTTQATTEPITQQSVGDIQLYAPEREGFDPQWGLPADLKGAELQNFAKQVQKLAEDTRQTMSLEQQFDGILTSLIDDKIADLYWRRLLGRGFRDQQLPLDWYELVKERNGIMASVAAWSEIMANGMAQQVILLRLGTVRVRIVGGKVIVGDQLFVSGLQRYIDQRLGYLQKAVPLAQNVANRTWQEFQQELKQNANQ